MQFLSTVKDACSHCLHNGDKPKVDTVVNGHTHPALDWFCCEALCALLGPVYLKATTANGRI